MESSKAGGHSVATLYDLMIRMFVASAEHEKAGNESLRAMIAVVEQRGIDRADSQDKANRITVEAAKDALGKSEYALDKRMELINEFRKQLGDQAATFVTKREYEERHASLTDKYDALNGRVGESMTRDEYEIRHKALEQRVDGNAEKLSTKIDNIAKKTEENVVRVERIESRQGGFSAGWGYLVGAIGLAVGIGTLILMMFKH